MVSKENVEVIERPEEVTAEWLGSVLGQAVRLEGAPSRIGTGQMSESYRVAWSPADGDGPGGSVVVKLPASDPSSRATGVGMGAYAREVAFYEQLAPRVGSAVPTCRLAAIDTGTGVFTLVLEDVAPARVGDQVAGCTPEEARAALTQLAAVQAPFLNDLALGMSDWLNVPNPLNQAVYAQVLPGALERYGHRLDDAQRGVLTTFGECVDAWWADQRPPLGLVHGDFRLDNLLFAGDDCTVVDWQTMIWGSPLYDVAYFIGGGLAPQDRADHEEALVRGYHDALLGHGIKGFDWEHCWTEYRRQTFGGILMAVVASMVVERTERGDEMFGVVLERNTRQILELDALSLLPSPGGKLPALRPTAEDEGLHEPGPEPLWNESVYLDAVNADGSLGVYVRLGRLPNQDKSIYTVCVCGPGRPSIMLALDDAPLPDAGDPAQVVDGPGIHAEHHVVAPLETFRVVLTGTAAAHEDPAAPLRAEAGEPFEIALDLTWETEGIPYRWRVATRYEIPCRVSGTVRIGDETIELRGPGQRDHSWGSRDWWAVDWMWTALHLDDGTHVHGVAVPGMPGGVGYAQRADELEELTGVGMEPQWADDGLVESATLTLEPADLELAIAPAAWGVLRLESPDGRLSHFPRAMCRATAADGRTGLGWMEWNRVQR